MEFGTAALFIGFVVLNTVFSYNAGKKDGIFTGMISITQFFRQKNVLKDKNKIIGFENWPLPVQVIYEDPDPEHFDE